MKQDNTKQRILECAKQLFIEHGFEKTSIRNLAIDAQVSHGLIRHHFGNKAQVWYAVADWILEEITADQIQLNEFAQRGLPANIATYLMISQILDNLTANPAIIKLMVQFSLGQQIHFDYFYNQLLLVKNDFRTLIEQCNEQGVLQGINASEIINMLLGMVSIPAAQPKLFIANYEHDVEPSLVTPHYLASIKSIFANLLQVDERNAKCQLDQFTPL